MTTSYPRRNTSGGIWKVTDAAKNLLEHGTWPGAASVPGVRGIFGAGYAPSYNNSVGYLTISTLGNASDFGDLSVTRSARAVNSFTRLVCGGGNSPPGLKNEMDYFTIASTGNAADFGDLSAARSTMGGKGNNTRGLFSGGAVPGNSNIMEYITIATTGNVLDFG